MIVASFLVDIRDWVLAGLILAFLVVVLVGGAWLYASAVQNCIDEVRERLP